MLFFFFATLVELFVRLVAPFKKITLKYSLCSLSSFVSSIIFFNRLRASIHIDYEPLVNEETSIRNSAIWYGKWWENNISKSNGNAIKVKNN